MGLKAGGKRSENSRKIKNRMNMGAFIYHVVPLGWVPIFLSKLRERVTQKMAWLDVWWASKHQRKCGDLQVTRWAGSHHFWGGQMDQWTPSSIFTLRTKQKDGVGYWYFVSSQDLPSP